MRIVQLLLQHGADVHAKDKGYVASHWDQVEKEDKIIITVVLGKHNSVFKVIEDFIQLLDLL